MQRINSFLGEEEVPDWASSLKRAAVPPDASHQTAPGQAEKIGYENATLEWHQASMQAKEDTVPGMNIPSEGADVEERLIENEEGHPRLDMGQPIPTLDPLPELDLIQEEATRLPPSQATVGPSTSRVQSFKLRNINVTLPPGRLTLVTGITGAGKTAFLVGLLGGELDQSLVETIHILSHDC
jgi:ABC-type multidrug transport system fused ATPase/permease subunit